TRSDRDWSSDVCSSDLRVPQTGQPAPSPGEPVVVDEIVPGSPAEEAHLEKGDVIKKFDGHEVKSFTDLRNLVSQADLNKKVELRSEERRVGKECEDEVA